MADNTTSLGPGASVPIPTAAGARARRRARGASSASEVPSVAPLGPERWSFEGVLRRVLGFSRAAELESESFKVGKAAAPSPAFDALGLFVRSLDVESLGKLRAVMQAGREAQALPVAVAALEAEQLPPGVRTPELFAGGAAALQDLQRGHAVACATAFDLELELGRWGEVQGPESLDERVWLRFGRELARSRMEEWSCFAVVDARDRLQKLYLRRGKARWWSFADLIDRPSERALGVSRYAKAGRSRLVVLPLEAALGRSRRGNLGAVKRASMAVSARLGTGRPSARRAAAAGASAAGSSR